MKLLEESIKKKIITILETLFPEAKIYLFGSRALGTNSEWSDIDLALDIGKKIDFVAMGEAKDVLAALSIPYKVDVVDFHNISEEMKQLILQDGIIWKK